MLKRYPLETLHVLYYTGYKGVQYQFNGTPRTLASSCQVALGVILLTPQKFRRSRSLQKFLVGFWSDLLKSLPEKQITYSRKASEKTINLFIETRDGGHEELLHLFQIYGDEMISQLTTNPKFIWKHKRPDKEHLEQIFDYLDGQCKLQFNGPFWYHKNTSILFEADGQGYLTNLTKVVFNASMETRFPLADCLVIYPWETLFVLFEEGYAGVVYDNNHNANRSRLRSKPFSKERELVESLLVAYAILCVANRYSKNGLIDLYGHFIGVFWKPLMDKIKNFRKETFGKVDVPALCEKANVSTTIEKSIGEALNFFLSIPEPEEKDYSLQIEDAKKRQEGRKRATESDSETSVQSKKQKTTATE